MNKPKHEHLASSTQWLLNKLYKTMAMINFISCSVVIQDLKSTTSAIRNNQITIATTPFLVLIPKPNLSPWLLIETKKKEKYIFTSNNAPFSVCSSQAHASLLGARTKSASRSDGGWKYPFFGGSLFFLLRTGIFFLGVIGHWRGILLTSLFGVSHPWFSLSSLLFSMCDLRRYERRGYWEKWISNWKMGGKGILLRAERMYRSYKRVRVGGLIDEATRRHLAVEAR